MTMPRGRTALVTVLAVAAPLGLAHAQQKTPPPPRPATVSPGAVPAAPIAAPRATAPAPQGFSVVLVLGDLQATGGTDDVPPAARKALADMRDFLPFKSYRLLDAAWLLCCSYDTRRPGRSQRYPEAGAELVRQVLRGPDEQEFELQLATSRAENSRVFVKFALETGAEAEPPAAAVAEQAQLARQLADLQDKRNYLMQQLQAQREKVDVGIAAGTDIPKLELEVRSIQRRMEELETRQAKAGTARTARAKTLAPRQKIIDTSFTMDVGETVVVGTSRLKGGNRALIALLTAVAPRAERRE